MNNDPLPLFPLQVVLLPEEILPLHIFEERYKEMIGLCLRENLPFGVVLVEESGLRRIGCTARITGVPQKYPDGRMNILTRGEERFRIRRVFEERAYMTAEVEYLQDAIEGSPSEQLVDEVVRAFRDISDKPVFHLEDPAADPARLSFLIGAALRLPLRSKQALLENDSAERRLQFLGGWIQKMGQRNEQASLFRERATRNGHPEKNPES